MHLRHATESALEAARARDLEALACALAAREEALARGEPVTIEMFDLGNRIIDELRHFRREIEGDTARLEQINTMLGAHSGVGPTIEVAG